MSKVVQMTFTDEQYAELKKRAGDQIIQHYLLGREFPKNDFEKWFPELLLRVGEIRNGTKFNIKAVFGTEWINIPKGIKLSLGRVFYQQVNASKVLNVHASERDKAKTQWYIKKEETK
jgi:hypothetical protein